MGISPAPERKMCESCLFGHVGTCTGCACPCHPDDEYDAFPIGLKVRLNSVGPARRFELLRRLRSGKPLGRQRRKTA